MEEFRQVKGRDNHIEVWIDGEFCGNYDSIEDYRTEKEVEEMRKEKGE